MTHAKRRHPFSYAVDLVLSLDEAQVLAKCKSPKASAVKPYHYELPENKRVSEFRPVIVGFGPAGMLAGLILAEAGLRPIIFERGKILTTGKGCKRFLAKPQA